MASISVADTLVRKGLFNFARSKTSTIIPVELWFGTIKMDCEWIKSTKPNQDHESYDVHSNWPDLSHGFMTFSVRDRDHSVDGVPNPNHEFFISYASDSITCVDYTINDMIVILYGQYLFLRVSPGSLRSSTGSKVTMKTGFDPSGKRGKEQSWITIKLARDDTSVEVMRNCVQGTWNDFSISFDNKLEVMERYFKIVRESNSKISTRDGTIISGSTYSIDRPIPMAESCLPIEKKIFNFKNSVTTKIIPSEVYFGTVEFDCNWIKSTKPKKVRKSAHQVMRQFKYFDGKLMEYTLPDLCYGFLTFSVIDHADLTDAKGIKLDDDRIEYELILDYSSKSIPSIDYAVIKNHSKECINGQYLFIKASLGSLNTSTAIVIIPGYNPDGDEVESFITIKFNEDAKIDAIKNAVRGKWNDIEPIEAIVRYFDIVKNRSIELPEKSKIQPLEGDMQQLSLEDEETESPSTYRTERNVGKILHPNGPDSDSFAKMKLNEK